MLGYMADEREPTYRELKLFKLLLQNVQHEYAGAELMELTGIPSGNLYPLLIRLQQAGMLDDRWEDIDPRQAGRPRRRYYRLSADGVERAQRVLRELALPPHTLKPEWGRS
jgi:PadR family transcriptional regulator, regulatory protein PadR